MNPIDPRQTSTMRELGKEHDVHYRQEVLKPLFDCIKSADSCYLIGAGSMGKTRLLDHLIRTDVQQHYLGEKAAHTLIIRLDMNRLSDYSEWEFYELMLFNIVQVSGQCSIPEIERKSAGFLQTFLLPVLDQPGNTLKALRFLELVITNLMVVDNDLSLCLLMDEFDEAYRHLPAKVFAHLRGIRDANKNRLCYALLMRNPPTYLRPNLNEHEGFYELLSRNQIAIGPYSWQDVRAMLLQLEARFEYPLNETAREKIYEVSGGHPGTVLALFTNMRRTVEGVAYRFDPRWLAKEETIKEECRKLLASLEPEEQAGILDFAKGNMADASPAIKALRAKKLLIAGEGHVPQIFSPIFAAYLQNLPSG
ncbi:MAG: hypothetical protein N2117_03470 [Anaerolineales bacterium]|nr:hypothetical protein [Anaerolineales bacterium]MCX7754292.1 hypothetical protein [Anaerolineales bacterium]MDW8278673.1 hypothetical protein [Anaerolineales bacterium]